MAAVSHQDLLDLLTILYQGSLQRNQRAVPPALPHPAAFFRYEDIELVAQDLNLPLPAAGVETTLRAGLPRGVFQRSIENGTQCGAFACDPPSAEGPVLVYAYNPHMLKVNPRNQELIAGTAAATLANYQTISGTAVRSSNNRAPFYGTRGSAVLDRDIIYKPYRAQPLRCCR